MRSRSAQASDERVRPCRRAQTAKRRVLVANDGGEGFGGSLELELEALGYDVTQVSDGAQVLESLAWAADGQNGWPDVLVLDLRSSSFGGLDVLSGLRGFANLPPTLLVSARSDQSMDVTVSLFEVQQTRQQLELNAVLAAVLAVACKRQLEQPGR